jgi:hypothetical protein
MLLALAVGDEVIIYDAGSRSKNGVSRVVWQGIPFIKYALHVAWDIPVTAASEPRVKAHVVTGYFDEVLGGLTDAAIKKLRYFKKFADTNVINLEGVTKPSVHDGRGDDIYRSLLQREWA